MRVAVIGCGSVGRRHIGNLLALGCEVLACDESAVALGTAIEQFQGVNFSGFLSFRGLDALVIATPYDNHLYWVEEAIRRKIAFFCEKPLGSLDQLPRWREIAAMDLPVNQVGYQLRFHEAFASLTNHVTKPTAGQFFVDCDMATWPGLSYGPPVLECSHEIDLALACGAPATVDSVDVEDGRARMWLGKYWHVDLGWWVPTYHRQWTLTRRGAEASAFFYAPEELGTEMYRAEMAHFLDCVREQKPTLCPLADGLRVLEVCAKIEALTKGIA